MILLAMILVLVFGGLIAWWVAGRSVSAGRWVAMFAVCANMALAIVLWLSKPLAAAQAGPSGQWFAMIDLPWIDAIGARFCLRADGLAVLLLMLVGVIGILAVAVSWRSLSDRVGLFHFVLLWSLASMVGVFTAMDLLLFYAFWELMLVPLFLLILIWGRQHRRLAAMKFFIYTQAGGLLLLIGILGLFFIHHGRTGIYTFNYFALLGEPLEPATGMLLMLAFLAAFAVKLPMVPLHGWLADAHAQAPVAGSVNLAGLVLKAGAYGLVRFLLPLFPAATATATLPMMILAVVGILYAAMLSFGQSDLKRLIAYTSISHMGFVLLGVFSWNLLALQGVVIIIIAHGIATAGLFALAGMLHERLGTYDIRLMGGLWAKLPRFGGAAMVLLLACMGLPGLANFVGEFLVLMGAYRANPTIAILAAGGLILSVTYSLKVMQLVFQGRLINESANLSQPSLREQALLAGCIVALVWVGLYPAPILRTSQPSLENLLQSPVSQSSKNPLPHVETVLKTPEGGRL
jgi:NADH-quinone oxidoreductase subunit M